MNNPLFQAICRTGIFMICAQAIVQFRPNESYEKYLKLLVSVMILVQLFLPIGRLFTGSGSMEMDALSASFRESLEQGMEETRRQAKEADALLQQMTLEEVRRRLEEQAAAAEKEENAKQAAHEEKAQKSKKESAVGGAVDEQTGGRVTVEVEPIAPIFGEQTGGMRGDGEQVE